MKNLSIIWVQLKRKPDAQLVSGHELYAFRNFIGQVIS